MLSFLLCAIAYSTVAKFEIYLVNCVFQQNLAFNWIGLDM
jgi:hypothetical protein